MTSPAHQGNAVAAYRERVLGALRTAFGHDARVTCTATRALGYSISFRFVVDQGPRSSHLFAKVRRASKFGGYEEVDPTSKTARLGRLEYETLQRADKWFSAHVPELGVVRPVVYIDECQALVVTAAEGIALDQLASVPRHALYPAAVGRAGRWLRLFHEHVGAPEMRPWDTTSFAARLRKVCASLLAAGVDGAIVRDIEERTQTQAGRTADHTCTRALGHGDYKLRHIWTTPHRMQVLDFGNVHVAPVAEDLAAFLVELEVSELGAIGQSTPSAHALGAAFLDAYGPIHAPRTLALQLVLARLKKWARRREKLSASSTARRVQRILRLTGTEQLARRQFIDPWFLARVEPELLWLERDPGRPTHAIGYTGALADAVRGGQPERGDRRA